MADPAAPLDLVDQYNRQLILIADLRAEVDRLRVKEAQILDECTVLHNACGRYENDLMRLRAENDQLRADAKLHAVRGEEPRD